MKVNDRIAFVEDAWKDNRREPRRHNARREVCGVQDRSKRKDRSKGKASAKKQGERGGTLRRYTGGLRDETGMKTYLRHAMDYAKKLKLRFWAGDLDLPEKRKRYTINSSREEEEGAQMCPCGKAVE